LNLLGSFLCPSLDLLKFLLVKAVELRCFPASIFEVDFEQACDEELLFLLRLSLPIVRFAQNNHKAYGTSPCFVVRIRRRRREGFD
jgi:hypothetical protein